MADLLFYQRITALNEHTHGELRVSPLVGHAYAAKTNAVPIVTSEFADCAREYPIAFVDNEDGPVAMALLGLRDNENLFVDVAGKWRARYIPAFVRRYPFVTAKGPQGNVLVCIDEASSCFSKSAGDPLFVDGKPAPSLEHAIRFLTEFQQSAEQTQAVGRRLKELGLLRQTDSVAQLNDGSQYRLSGLLVVDENKLKALPAETVQTLFADGLLALVYAHLVSLGNLGALVDRIPGIPAKKTANAA